MKAYDVDGLVEVLERNPSRQAGILSVRKRFNSYCFDSRNCKEGLAHLELYHRKYDKRRKVFLHDPVHDSHSHAADALRMEAESKDSRNDQFYKVNNFSVITDYDLFE